MLIVRYAFDNIAAALLLLLLTPHVERRFAIIFHCHVDIHATIRFTADTLMLAIFIFIFATPLLDTPPMFTIFLLLPLPLSPCFRRLCCHTMLILLLLPMLFDTGHAMPLRRYTCCYAYYRFSIYHARRCRHFSPISPRLSFFAAAFFAFAAAAFADFLLLLR